MDRLAAGADAERVIQELTDADIDVTRVRDIVGTASGDLIRRNHYEVLGVTSSASLDEIRTAYRQKALQYHPDQNINPGAAERFKQINDIYQTLSDDQKRAEYDHSLSNTNGGFRKNRQGTKGSSARREHDPRQRGPRSTSINNRVREFVWNRLLEGQHPDKIIDQLVELGINEPVAKSLVFQTVERMRQYYYRHSQRASSDRYRQSTTEKTEPEESWFKILTRVIIKFVICAGLVSVIGLLVLLFLLWLRMWQWWD